MGPNEFEESGEYQGAGKVTIRQIIDCIQPRHQGVYTCVGQANGQSMASDPVPISVEGTILRVFIFIHSLTIVV